MTNEQEREAVARAICKACEEDPDHLGDARGNAYRWQDYLDVADAAINARAAHEASLRELECPPDPATVDRALDAEQTMLKLCPHLWATPARDNWIAGYEAAMGQKAGPVTRPGWKLVPVEPTPEMLKARAKYGMSGARRHLWAAMLAAAPTTPPTEQLAAGEAVPAIERDEEMQRDYIPLPGGWELQTKGNGSTLRLLDKKAGERHPLMEPQHVTEFIERMAREIHAAWSATQPAEPTPEQQPDSDL